MLKMYKAAASFVLCLRPLFCSSSRTLLLSRLHILMYSPVYGPPERVFVAHPPNLPAPSPADQVRHVGTKFTRQLISRFQSIAETTRRVLHVRNLPLDATQQELS